MDIVPSKSSTAKHRKKGLNFLCSNHMLLYFCAYHPGHLLKEGTLCFIGYVVDKWVRVDTA